MELSNSIRAREGHFSSLTFCAFLKIARHFLCNNVVYNKGIYTKYLLTDSYFDTQHQDSVVVYDKALAPNSCNCLPTYLPIHIKKKLQSTLEIQNIFIKVQQFHPVLDIFTKQIFYPSQQQLSTKIVYSTHSSARSLPLCLPQCKGNTGSHEFKVNELFIT